MWVQQILYCIPKLGSQIAHHQGYQVNSSLNPSICRTTYCRPSHFNSRIVCICWDTPHPTDITNPNHIHSEASHLSPAQVESHQCNPVQPSSIQCNPVQSDIATCHGVGSRSGQTQFVHTWRSLPQLFCGFHASSDDV